jgi:hypothetical protein
MLSLMTRALRDLALARDGVKAKPRMARKSTRRPYQWRPMYVPPLRSDRWRRD